jgi:hypothetical protein
MVARRKLSTASVLTLATAAAKVKAPLESVEQRFFVQRVRTDPRTRGLLWTATAGGMQAMPRHKNKMVKEGLAYGVPDLLFFEPKVVALRKRLLTPETFEAECLRYNGLAIEMKRKPNKPTPEQREWLTGLEARGWSTAVCYSAEEAWTTLTDYLGIAP